MKVDDRKASKKTKEDDELHEDEEIQKNRNSKGVGLQLKKKHQFNLSNLESNQVTYHLAVVLALSAYQCRCTANTKSKSLATLFQ